MTKNNYLWTSESVSEGHPDKVADQISDAVLDEILTQDKDAKVACETLVTTNFAIVAGEVSTHIKNFNVEEIVRKTIIDIGYDRDELGFNGNTVEITNKIHEQSEEINKAVTKDDKNIGAGDQGIMFGYATNETPDYMPLTIWLARKITSELTYNRNFSVDFLRPDAKSQITIEFDKNNIPVRINTVVISTQHSPQIDLKSLISYFMDDFIPSFIKKLPTNIALLFDNTTKYLINPSGSFIIGGPHGDTGLTGRKIVIDNYGADCQIGGGAFSGKDYTKVDRSAAYMARFIAKNVVSNKFADKVKVQLSYAIGISEPTSIRIETINPAISNEEIEKFIIKNYDLTPNGIVKKLKLKNPIFLQTAKTGHFGNIPYNIHDIEFFTWENHEKMI